jgi:hypothetical protein
MSTKTTFKRIALVAVAALGLGVLSVAPSQATVVASTLTLGTTASTATVGESASTTLTNSFISTAAYDSVTVAGYITSSNGANASVKITMEAATDSSTSSASNYVLLNDATVNNNVHSAGTVDGNLSVNAKYTVYLVNPTAAGTYTVVFYQTPYTSGTAGGAGSASTTTATWTITVAAANTAATAASTASVRFGDGSSNSAAPFGGTTEGTDSATVAAKSSTALGYTVWVKLKNSAGSAATESITAVISGQGYISSSTTRSTNTALTLKNGSGESAGVPVYVFSTGTAGTATLTLSTPSYTFPAKTLTFSGAATKIAVSTAVAPLTVIRAKVGTSTSNVAVIKVTDAAAVGLTSAQTFTVTSSATAQISSASVGSYDSTLGGYPLTVVTGAAPTSGTEVTLTVSIADPADTTGVAKLTTTHKVKMGGSVAKEVISFDKTSYTPGEQMVITITATDASGNPVYDGAAAPALSSNKTIQGLANVATSYTGGKADSVSRDTDGSVLNTYRVYAPATSGEFKVTATGTDAAATLLSASATVADPSVDAATDAANEATDAANAATDAALAAADAADAATAAAQDASDAVAALSAEVSKMIASLKAQITSLTNLVIKIQKKVKA